MEKRIFIAVVMAAAMALSSPAIANVYNFTPTDSDLADLPHATYLTWGVNLNLSPGETITGATLTYKNIYDWRVEPDDHLYTTLLDNPSSGVRFYVDNQGGGNNFAGQGTLVGNWNDPAGGAPNGTNLVYDFGQLGLIDALNQYASTAPGRGQANIGFGLDPDCHYYNSGVTFTVRTSPIVPAPEAILLGGFGVALVGLMRRKQIL
jgi:hypothetical protein